MACLKVVRSVLSLSVFLELPCLGSAPNSVPGASPAQLPYAARADSSAVRLRFSLRTSLLAGIVRFGALSNMRAGLNMRILKTAKKIKEIIEAAADFYPDSDEESDCERADEEDD